LTEENQMADIDPQAQVIIARVYIREYAAVGWADSVGAGGVSGPDAALPAPQEPGLADQVLQITIDPPGPAVVSQPFHAETRFIALYCNNSYQYVVGPNPVATHDSFRMPGLMRLYVGVSPGHRMSVITAL
jgi:hypothetical protein